MKVSIITVCFNSKHTIAETINSVLSQDYKNIEYIVVDGNSADGTLEIISKYRGKISKFLSEPDNGIYDAMNKGIKLASGDTIGILNSDDIYANSSVIANIANFITNNNLDAVYGDIVYVDKHKTNKIKRYWKAGNYKKGAFLYGWAPPHPAFFCRKQIYEKYGSFRTDLKIAADFELMLRLMEKYEIKTGYLPEIMVKMREGGKANVLRGIIQGNCEIIRSFRLNNLHFSPFFFISKPLKKTVQIFNRPKC